MHANRSHRSLHDSVSRVSSCLYSYQSFRRIESASETFENGYRHSVCRGLWSEASIMQKRSNCPMNQKLRISSCDSETSRESETAHQKPARIQNPRMRNQLDSEIAKKLRIKNPRKSETAHQELRRRNLLHGGCGGGCGGGGWGGGGVGVGWGWGGGGSGVGVGWGGGRGGGGGCGAQCGVELNLVQFASA